MKQSALKIINPILMISFLIQFIAVGCMVGDVFDRKSEIHGIIFKAHMLNGQIILVLALIHLIYNWSWIKAQFRTSKK